MAEAKCDRDGDGDAKSMSLDEFKQEMFRSLRDTGTVEMIRVRALELLLSQLRLVKSSFNVSLKQAWYSMCGIHLRCVQAQLRRKFIEKLQQHGMKDRFVSTLDEGDGQSKSGAINNESLPGDLETSNNNVVSATVSANANRMHWSGDEKLVNGLLVDYFAKKALEHSTAVFVPEIGGAKNYVAVDTILQVHMPLYKRVSCYS